MDPLRPQEGEGGEGGEGGSGKLILLAPNAAVRAWAEKNLPPEIAKMENPPEAVVIVDAHRKADAVNGAEVRPVRASASAESETVARPKRRSVCEKTGLRPDLVFENFVPGDANAFSLTAAKTLAKGGDEPDLTQLFIYGGTGLGKTHLIHAIGNRFLAAHPDARVRYAQARDFMSDVVAAFRHDREAKLREKYHSLDLLLVDDIQYIGGDRQRTQEEFFYLFNLLQDRRSFVAFACDRLPAKIDGLAAASDFAADGEHDDAFAAAGFGVAGGYFAAEGGGAGGGFGGAGRAVCGGACEVQCAGVGGGV